MQSSGTDFALALGDSHLESSEHSHGFDHLQWSKITRSNSSLNLSTECAEFMLEEIHWLTKYEKTFGSGTARTLSTTSKCVK